FFRFIPKPSYFARFTAVSFKGRFLNLLLENNGRKTKLPWTLHQMALERNILETVQQCMLGRVPIGSTGFVVNAMSTLITLAQDFVDASDAPTKSAKSEKWSLNTMTSTTRTTTMATRSTTYLTVLTAARLAFGVAVST
ncbi:hypothetical protein PF006_g31332, partial [Phytophthora fragariae]